MIDTNLLKYGLRNALTGEVIDTRMSFGTALEYAELEPKKTANQRINVYEIFDTTNGHGVKQIRIYPELNTKKCR